MSPTHAFVTRPRPEQRSGGGLSLPESLRMLRQPHVLLCALYAVAICFETLIEIDVFKPYRLIGAALVVLMLIRGAYLVDRLAKLAMAFLGTGFLVALVQSILGPGDFGILLSTAARWCFNLATFIAIASLMKTREELILVAVIHAVTLLVAAYGISLEASKEEMYGAVMGRASGDFGNPANACVAMLFTATVLTTAIRRKFSAPGAPMAAFRVVTIVAVCTYLLYMATLTGSRAGAGLLLVGLAVYFMLTLKQRAAFAMAFCLGALALVALSADIGFSEQNVLAARIEKKGWDTARLYLWLGGLDAFADTLGLGVGMARYMLLHKDYFAPYAYSSDPRWLDKNLTLHNDYVVALVEFGVIGFIFFVLLCVQLWRMTRQLGDPDLRAIACAVLIGMAINGLTHSGLPYFIVWFYFALLSAWINMEYRPKRKTMRPRLPRGPGLRTRVKALR